MPVIDLRLENPSFYCYLNAAIQVLRVLPQLSEKVNEFYERNLDESLQESDQHRNARLILSEIFRQNQPYSYKVGPALVNLKQVFHNFDHNQQEDSHEAVDTIIGTVFPEEWQNLFRFEDILTFNCECGRVRINF